MCQKWDSNPRPHTWTRTLSVCRNLQKEFEPWVWRLRPLGHPDLTIWQNLKRTLVKKFGAWVKGKLALRQKKILFISIGRHFLFISIFLLFSGLIKKISFSKKKKKKKKKLSFQPLKKKTEKKKGKKEKTGKGFSVLPRTDDVKCIIVCGLDNRKTMQLYSRGWWPRIWSTAKIFFWQFVFPWVNVALLKPMKNFPWEKCVIQAKKNKVKSCSFFDALLVRPVQLTG